jgi:hypothetical protein
MAEGALGYVVKNHMKTDLIPPSMPRCRAGPLSLIIIERQPSGFPSCRDRTPRLKWMLNPKTAAGKVCL